MEEEFDKKDWVLNYKKMEREFNADFTSRFKSLILYKREDTSFIDDSNREATKLNSQYIKFKDGKVKEINDIKGKFKYPRNWDLLCVRNCARCQDIER